MWSCAIPASNGESAFFSAAFFGLSSASDVCGYCGQEFSPDPPNWRERKRHLDDQHRFRECDYSGEVFRGDFILDHLQDKHALRLGHGSYDLVLACAKAEPVPQLTNDDDNKDGTSEVLNLGKNPSNCQIDSSPWTSWKQIKASASSSHAQLDTDLPIEGVTSGDESDFWTGQQSSRRTSSVKSYSSSVNSSLHGSEEMDTDYQSAPAFSKDSQSLANAKPSLPSRRKLIPQPPSAKATRPIAKRLSFSCEICNRTVRVRRRRDWQ